MMYDSDHMSGWGWAFMTAGSILVWAVVIFAVVMLIRHLTGQPADQLRQPTEPGRTASAAPRSRRD
jgi:hypothetical protein